MAPEAKEVAGLGVKAGLTILESSLLGAFALLCLAVGVAGVWLAFRTQNARVEDQKKLSEKLEKLVVDQGHFNNKTTTALERLNESEQTRIGALGGLQTTMQSILQALMHRGGR